MKQRACFETNYAIAQADFSNPFVSVISFILTDFLPNKNGQAVAIEEKDRIIETAKGMPFKMNVETGGHEGAETIGPIVKTWFGNDNNRPVVYAEAIIWKLEYPDIDRFIQEKYQNQEPLAVSWELLYSDSEVDNNNVQWLKNVIVTGVALVSQPAYGTYRTRILAVAEEQTTEASMIAPDEQLTDAQMTGAQMTGAHNVALPTVASATELTPPDTTMLERELEQARAEIAQLRDQIAALKNELTFAQRKDVLREFFHDVDDRRDFVLSLSEEAFRSYVNDLRAMKQNVVVQSAQSELYTVTSSMKPAIPAGLANEPLSVVDLFKRLV
jgi:hypothetical protein